MNNHIQKDVSQHVINSNDTNSPDKHIQMLSSIEPSVLSRLLKTHGPLAMRHITQLLSEEVPQFQDMSSSKKRRLIMTALEKGDERNQVLFQKVGWGLWQIVTVDPNLPFEQQRQNISSFNKQRKDSISNDSHHDINIPIIKKDTKSDLVSTDPVLSSPKPVYIDEYAVSLSSDEEEEEEENLEENQIDCIGDLKSQTTQSRRGSSNIYPMKRRVSYVVNSPDNIITQPTIHSNMQLCSSSSSSTTTLLLPPQKGHSLTKNRKRRSSSNKSKTINISENGHLCHHHHHHHTPLQRVRSTSMSKESSLRTTLSHSNNTTVTPLTSTSQFSLKLDKLETYDVKVKEEKEYNNPSSHTLGSDKSLGFLLERSTDQEYEKTDDRSDTEEEDWKNIDPRTLTKNHIEDTTTTDQDNTVVDTKEIANLLLSLK